MDLIFILLIFAIGFGIGNMYASFKFVKALKDAAEQAGIDLDEQIKKDTEKTVHKLLVEQHGETLYLFDKEKDNFICQGSNLEELAKLAKQYKDIKLATVIHGNKVFMFIDGNTKEYTG